MIISNRLEVRVVFVYAVSTCSSVAVAGALYVVSTCSSVAVAGAYVFSDVSIQVFFVCHSELWGCNSSR
jgi:hypothetical protein